MGVDVWRVVSRFYGKPEHSVEPCKGKDFKYLLLSEDMTSDLEPERNAADRNVQKPPKLIKFRHMTGIDTPATLHNRDSRRAARNLGVYTRIVYEERKATYQYHIMSLIINASFLSQIIVAATLTALGASDGSRIVITILGSVNTVIAGIQTYLKGQGCNRLKQYQFGLRKLREYVDDRERDFSNEGCKLNVDHVVADVAAMYQAVRQTAEDNTPDTYLPMEGAGKKLLGQKDNRVTPVEQLAPGEYDKGGSGTMAASAEIDDLRAAEEAEATGAGASLSGGNGGAQSKAGVTDDNEATPLLKRRES